MLTGMENSSKMSSTRQAPRRLPYSKTDSTSGTRRPIWAGAPISLSMASEAVSLLARVDSPPPSMLRLKLTAIRAPSGHAGSGGCSPYPTRSRAAMGSGFGSNMVGLRIRSPFLQEVSVSTRARQRREAGIVAEEPIWLRGAVHPAVLDRNALHLGYAGNARRLIT